MGMYPMEIARKGFIMEDTKAKNRREMSLTLRYAGDEPTRRRELKVRMEALQGDNSCAELQKIQKEKDVLESRLKWFFLEYLEFEDVAVPDDYSDKDPMPARVATKLANRIYKRLEDNPFGTCSERTINRWLSGKSKMSRASAYHICIAFKLGLEMSNDLFVVYRREEFTRYNDIDECVYRYALIKGLDLEETYELWTACNKIIEDAKKDLDFVPTDVRHTTMVIQNDFGGNTIGTEQDFKDFIGRNKWNFHIIRKTRLKEFQEQLKIFSRRNISIDFAKAFYVPEDKITCITDYDDEEIYASTESSETNSDSDEEDTPENKDKESNRHPRRSNYEYFSEALKLINERKRNFSRELYILCLLLAGISDRYEINAALSKTALGFAGLYVHDLFDACIFEACEYSKKTCEDAFSRFCEKANWLEFERPLTFAYLDSLTLPDEKTGRPLRTC